MIGKMPINFNREYKYTFMTGEVAAFQTKFLVIIRASFFTIVLVVNVNWLQTSKLIPINPTHGKIDPLWYSIKQFQNWPPMLAQLSTPTSYIVGIKH